MVEDNKINEVNLMDEEEHYEEPPHDFEDYSEEIARDEEIEKQNAKDEYEFMQSANAEVEAMAEQEAQRAEAEYQELHKDCISKQKVKEVIKIIRALEDFKLKCYERMNKGNKDFDDFIMNNAPCNYDLSKIERELGID